MPGKVIFIQERISELYTSENGYHYFLISGYTQRQPPM